MPFSLNKVQISLHTLLHDPKQGYQIPTHDMLLKLHLGQDEHRLIEFHIPSRKNQTMKKTLVSIQDYKFAECTRDDSAVTNDNGSTLINDHNIENCSKKIVLNRVTGKPCFIISLFGLLSKHILASSQWSATFEVSWERWKSTECQ